MRSSPMTDEKSARPRSIANDLLDAVEAATHKWTRQKKSEERHPGMRRYRVSRLTREPRTSQKDAAWQVMKESYLATSGPRNLPAESRQIFYQARPKIMALTEDKELDYNYFSQTLVPDYIEGHPRECASWNVVYDARGHFEEPHTNRRIGCGTLEVRNYLRAMEQPEIIPAEFSDASVEIVGPSGGFSAILYIEKEGFGPLFKAVDLAHRYDLMIVSNKGLSVTAARKLIDEICGSFDLPLFVLHDFDFDGFKILGTLHRDTRRYQFTNAFEVIDLGLRLEDIAGLEREPRAATKMSEVKRRTQLAANGATDAEIDILVHERVELNAMTSEALITMIERKLKAHGIKKVIPDDKLLDKTYRTFHRSNELREEFEDLVSDFEASKIKVPKNLKARVQAILKKEPDLRWDEALKLVLDATQLDAVRAAKQEAKRKSGDFSDDEDEE
jgi:Topoisomerase 6 subunit A/Spo11, Toprim domain